MSSPSPTSATEPVVSETQRARSFPVTRALLIVNIVIFALEELWGGSTSTDTLVRMGALIKGYPEFESPLDMVTYGYLHIGPLHIAVNMFALWNLGRVLEPMLGAGPYFVLYNLALVGGGFATYELGDPEGVTAGASGAIFGLLGGVSAVLVQRYRASRSDMQRRSIRGVLGQVLVPNVLISFLPGISLTAHVGGLLAGAVFMALLLAWAAQVKKQADKQPALRAFQTLAGLAALATAAALAIEWSTFVPWRSPESLL